MIDQNIYNKTFIIVAPLYLRTRIDPYMTNNKLLLINTKFKIKDYDPYNYKLITLNNEEYFMKKTFIDDFFSIYANECKNAQEYINEFAF